MPACDNLNDIKGYRWNSDVYYIMPGSVPPEGMVLISCQEHVDRMMEVLQGIKKCDLFLVRNGYL